MSIDDRTSSVSDQLVITGPRRGHGIDALLCLHLLMVSGYRLPDDLAWACLRMHLDNISPDKILLWTGVSSRQLRRLVQQFRMTGLPFKPSTKRTGRRRKLEFNLSMVRDPHKLYVMCC
jgi:hypothetical protein